MPVLATRWGKELRQRYAVDGWRDIEHVARAERVPVVRVDWLQESYGVPGLTYDETILIDSTLPRWMQAMTLAHELYHWKFDSPALARLLWGTNDVRVAQMEARATAFAAALVW